MPFVILTGLSGAGKTQAVDAFEDAGYFCVDNLPPQLLSTLVDLVRLEGSKVDRSRSSPTCAAASTSRELERCSTSCATAGVNYTLVFLEASDEALVRRFKETRRRHPLAGRGTVLEGIRASAPCSRRCASAPTTSSTPATSHPASCATRINDEIIHRGRRQSVVFTFVSFGYKYGVPLDADLLFDVRFLPNPFYDPELRPLTGLDPPVRDYVVGRSTSRSSRRAFCRCSTTCSRATLPRARRTSPSASAVPAAVTARSPSRAARRALRLAGLPDDRPAPRHLAGTDAQSASAVAVSRAGRQTLGRPDGRGAALAGLRASRPAGAAAPPTSCAAELGMRWTGGHPLRAAGFAGLLLRGAQLCRGLGLIRLFCASRARPAAPTRSGRPPAWLAGPRIVAIGGGTGLAALLCGLKHHTSNLTAIVTVADDGGSSGACVATWGCSRRATSATALSHSPTTSR